jgi:predicted ATPase
VGEDVMPQVSIQVITPTITNLFACSQCERMLDFVDVGQQVHHEAVNQYPKEMKQDAARLADWLSELISRYGDQVDIRIIDAQSMEGIFKSLRYWVRSYPAFIVDGRQKIIGWDQAALDKLLQAQLTGR